MTDDAPVPPSSSPKTANRASADPGSGGDPAAKMLRWIDGLSEERLADLAERYEIASGSDAQRAIAEAVRARLATEQTV